MTQTTEKKEEYTRGLGRRKTSAARVRLQLGKGEIVVNGKSFKEYFNFFELQETVLSPLKSVSKEKKFDISVKVEGGGLKSQAEAIRHGIARALAKYDPELKKTLKTDGYLTRDARVKERKKPGLKKARRAPQWSKR